jgi:tRNA-specific 2-thiouridylase
VSTGQRSYVIELDRERNRVLVGPGELLARRGLVADRVTWVAGGPPPGGPFEAGVKVRYQGADVPAVVEPADRGTTARVEFRTPQRAIAPGQSVVFYGAEEVLGGGVIREALR